MGVVVALDLTELTQEAQYSLFHAARTRREASVEPLWYVRPAQDRTFGADRPTGFRPFGCGMSEFLQPVRETSRG